MVIDLPMFANPPDPGAVLITYPLVGIYRNMDCKSSGSRITLCHRYKDAE
jgi:hypothetical protein